MTTYEKCCGIRHRILTAAAEVATYESWSDEFAVKRIRELSAGIIEHNPGIDTIQPCEMSTAQLDELGFCKLSEDNPMRLIPLWLHPYLAENVKLVCIDGSETVSKYAMDNDHRGGYMAHGIVPVDHAATYGQRVVRIDG